MLRIDTTLCPSCSRNVPANAGVCVLCGVPTSTSTFAEVAETPDLPISGRTTLSYILDWANQMKMDRVLARIEHDTRMEWVG